jgi:hypothetical protein
MVGISGASQKPLRADQAENLDLLVAPKRQRHVDALHAEGNVAGKNAGDLRGPAAIGHHAEMGAGHHVEQAHIDCEVGVLMPIWKVPGFAFSCSTSSRIEVDRDIDVADQRGRDQRDAARPAKNP